MKGFELKPHLGPLILYTRRLAALIGAGISLTRCCQMLQNTTDDPTIATANGELSKQIEDGITLSAAMAQRPDLFSPFYIAFVRAGEIGGVLDEALEHLATWLERERDAAERLRANILLLELAAQVMSGPGSPTSRHEVEAAVRDSKRVARIGSFCRLFEMCLSAGVPLNLAAATAADVLEGPAATRVRAAAEAMRGEGRIADALAEVEELRPVVAAMVATGEEHGCLDLMLRKAAEFMDAEAAHLLHSAVRFPGD